MTDEKPQVDPKVAELTEKVNSLLSELEKEKAARVRVEKTNSIQKTWADFKDDGTLDLPTVEYVLKNYKPSTAAGKTNTSPAPTGGKKAFRTPLGMKDDVPDTVKAVMAGEAHVEDDA